MNYHRLGMGAYQPGADPRVAATQPAGTATATKAGGLMILALVLLAAYTLRKR